MLHPQAGAAFFHNLPHTVPYVIANLATKASLSPA